MNKFIVKPNKSVKEIIEAKKQQEALKPSDDSGDMFRWDLDYYHGPRPYCLSSERP